MQYDVKIYGNPVLKEKSTPVEKIDDGVRRLVKDMLTTMYRSNGLGLASEQIGRTEAICVIDVPAHRKDSDGLDVIENPDIPMPLALINPRIAAMEGTESAQEGCLSFPELFVSIKRARKVTVEFSGLDGRPHELTAVGLLARAIQHEVDHLNGVLLVDRMSGTQKVANAGKLRTLKRLGKVASEPA